MSAYRILYIQCKEALQIKREDKPMSEINKTPNVPEEIKDDDLEQVAGGLTIQQMQESVALKKSTGTCPYM